MKLPRVCCLTLSIAVSFLPATAIGSETSFLAQSHDAKASTGTRPVSVDDMITLRALGGMAGEGLSVSPDGKYVAFQMHQASLARNSYEVAWFVLDLAGEEKPVYLGDAGNPLLFRSESGSRINGAWRSTDPVWSPDSKWIAYRRMDGDSVQLWRSGVDGSVQEQLTHNDARVDAFRWADDGTRIFFETGASLEQQTEFLASKAEGGFWVGDDYFNPRTMSYLLQDYELTGGRPKLRVLELPAKQERLASDAEARRHFGLNSVSPDAIFGGIRRASRMAGRPLSRELTVSSDGNRVAWLEAKVEAVYPRLQVWAKSGDLDTVQCEFKECVGRIERLWWRDNREVVFLRREGADFGRQVIYGWDTVTDNVRRIYADTTRHLSACSSSGDLLVCFSDEPDRPRTIVSVEFIDGSVKEMFDPNPPFDRILVGAAERLEWRNSYGVESWGWVVKPVGYEEGKRYPLVIVQYLGYACFEGGTGAEYPAHLFAAAGFAVLCFDEPGMWDVYETMTLMEAQEIAWEDYYDKRVILASLEAAIEMLDGRGLIDPARVGITGLSSGSDTISFALSHTDRFSAAISSSGGWNPNSYYLSAGWVRTFNSKRGFGRPGSANDKYWSGMSLAANAERVNTPLLVLASDNEALYQMFQYVTLQELGKPIDMYVFPDEYHIKWHPQNRKSVAVRAVDWMRFWLRDEEDSHPAKAEQYARWRKMRETTDAPAIAGGRK